MLLIPGLREEDLWDSLAYQRLGEFQARERPHLRTTETNKYTNSPQESRTNPQAKTIRIAPEDNSHGCLWPPHKHGHTYMSSLVTIDTQTRIDVYTADFQLL